MKVNWRDVVELCEELGVVKRIKDEPDEDYELRVAESICEDQEGFMSQYTKALLNAIEIGHINLTGKTEWYKGFGMRTTRNRIEMVLTTPCKKPNFAI